MLVNKRNFIVCLSLLYVLFVSSVAISEYRHMMDAPRGEIMADDYIDVPIKPVAPQPAQPTTQLAADRVTDQQSAATVPIPEVTPSRSKPVNGLVILMYHELGSGPNSLYVPENNFREQMHYLKVNGFNVIPLSSARDLLLNRGSTTRTVAITFDDGYLSFYTKAWPVLKEYGYPATLFVCSQLVGCANYCNWEQLKEVQAAGIEIGSHTRTHPSLPSLNLEDLNKEVSGSKQEWSRLGGAGNCFLLSLRSFRPQNGGESQKGWLFDSRNHCE
jgi:hypothetical protein